METKIKIDGLSKSYIDAAGFTKQLFENLSFEIEQKGITTILAPRGSGKSTLLKIVAGLENASSGSVNSVGKVLFISGESAIFPWMNVVDNVTYNLPDFDDEMLKELLHLVGLDGYEDHVPNKKSAGFIFRVALARSILRKPSLIVLDESFEKMKPEIRKKNLLLVRKIADDKQIPFLFATMNISSSIFLSDRVVILKSNPGEIISDENIVYDVQRDESIFENKTFHDYRKKIESIIENESQLHSYQFTI